MILRRLIVLAVILSGLTVSGCVVVIAVIFGVFAVLEPWLGAPGAGAAMFGFVGLVMGAAALVLFSTTRRRVTVFEKPASPVAGVIDTLSELVRERPVMVVAAAIGAGVLAIRNPHYLASALRALTAPRNQEDY